MSRREAVKLLKTEKEIITLDRDSHILFASLGIEMAFKGQEVKAKLVAGPWKNCLTKATTDL